MRLQNIYDSIEPAIMSKVEAVIADKELVFTVTDLVLGSDELKKVVDDGISSYCEMARRLSIASRMSGASGALAMKQPLYSLNDRTSCSGLQDARGIASAGEESRIYGSYGMGGPSLRGLL